LRKAWCKISNAQVNDMRIRRAPRIYASYEAFTIDRTKSPTAASS
jgi:hypothetical protein